MNTRADSNAKSGSPLGGLEKYGMLLMGIFLVILSGGRFVTPAAAFLAPVFLLCFTRNTSVKTGLSILYVLLFLSLMVRLHGYMVVPRPLNLLYIAGFACLEWLPFVLDRKLHKRLPGFLVPLVLPASVVVLAFFSSMFLPFGTMGEKAYSQIGNPELKQLLSVTGTHGITFIIYWFAATMASLWDTGFVWRRCRSQIVPLALCLMIIFVAGGFRTIFDENESPTVGIAGIVADHTSINDTLKTHGINNDIAGLAQSRVPADAINAALDGFHDDLFLETQIQADAGADIVVWAESGGVVLKSREKEFIDTVQGVARDKKIFLAAALFVIPDNDQGTLIENKLLVFGPDGERLGEYVKARSLWGQAFVEGDGEPLLIETPYGSIAFAIGFDLDFPAAIRSEQSVDIIIAPSSDWKTLSPHHSLMATFRGVENGASLFRPTHNGVSVASDSLGRILAQTDHSRNDNKKSGSDRASVYSFVADIPTRGVDTFYGSSGDWFAWLNVVLIAGLLVAAAIFSRRQKDPLVEAEQFDYDERRDRSRITAIQWRDSERDNNLHRNE